MTADTARSYNGGDKSAMGSARTSRRHSARLTVVDEQQADQYDKGGGVRIGDVVSLRAAELPGALVSDGFVDLACYVEDVDAAPGAQAFLAPLFVVCVHHTYAAREAYAAALAIDLPAAGYLQMGERRAVLEKQATNAASERLSNVHDEERSHGRWVAYGERIQLRHMKSGAYLTSRPRNASSTEADQVEGAHEVFMAPQPSQTAGFAIEPRFKIQSHGEVLCYGDCTTLALDKNPSLFIRADAPPADYSAIPDPQRDFARPEIHARSRLHVSALCLQFSWRFERYASSANVSPTFRPRCEHVLGGDVVRLVHKESDTQLALRRVGGTQRGSAAHAGFEIAIVPASEDVGALGFWRLELETWSSGDVMEFGMGCRFRHVVAEAFLQVSPGWVGLSDFRTIGTVHIIEPAFSTDGGVRWGSCFHLQAGDFMGYVQLVEDTKPTSLGVTSSLSRSNAFFLDSPGEARGRLAHKAVSVRNILRDYLAALRAGVSLAGTNTTHRRMREILVEAADQCVSPSEDHSSWKDLLRHVEVLDLIADVTVEIWKLLTATASGGGSQVGNVITGVFHHAHRALQEAVAGQKINGTYLIARVPEWQEQLRAPLTGPDAASTLSVMLEDNMAVVSALPRECLDLFISQAADAEEVARAANLRFIACLTSVRREGVRFNQEAVAQTMLHGHAPLFPKILTGEREGVEVALPFSAAISPGAGGRGTGGEARVRAPAVTLRSLYRDPEGNKGKIAAFEAAVRLFTSLCFGNDQDMRTLIGGPHRLVSHDALLGGMDDDALPRRARAMLARLMEALFVARPEEDHILARLTTHLLHEIDASSLDLPMPSFEVPKQFRMFRPVKESVIRTLAAAKKDSTQQYKGTAVQDPAGDVAAPHVLSLAMASLGEEMLKLGLFSSKDEIQTGLIPALALHLDMPAVGGCVEEVDTKVVVCRMLIKICDVRLGVRVPLLLAVFKTVTSEGKGSERSEIELRRMTEQLVSSANEDIHKLLSFLSLTLLKADGQAIARQLVKLIGVPREDLALLALQLLLRERSPKLELFRELSNTQILLEPATISAYRRCSSHMRNIRHVLPLLKSALAGDFEAVGTMSSSKRLSVLEALEDCGTMCKVAAGKDGGRVALVNTETVRRAGMQQLVIDIISSALVPYADPNGRFVLGDARGNNHESPKAGAGGSFQTGNSKKTSMEWLHGVLQLCFRFVEHTAHISEQTQMAFAPHVRLLLALAGEGCHAVSAVSAICHNNLKLCVSLDEALIERLAAVIAGSDGKPARRLPHYLRFLERLCVVQGTAVLQNQHYVLKQLCQKGPLKLSTTSLPPGASANHAASATAEIPEAALVLFRGVAGERMRHLLAEQGGGAANILKPEGLLAYNLALLRLLQTLLAERDAGIVSRIRVLLPPTKIKDDVLSRHTLPPARSRLLQLMRSLYLHDHREAPHPLLAEALWDMMVSLSQQLRAEPLDAFSRYAKKKPHDLPQLLCEDWAPLCLATLRNRAIMPHATEAHRSAAGGVVDVVIDILNLCSLHPEHAALLLSLYEAARVVDVPIAAILSDQAVRHAHSGGEGPSAFKSLESEEGGEAVERTAADEQAVGEAALLEKRIAIFSRAFLDAFDPIDTTTEVDRTEKVDLRARIEIQELCASFKALAQQHEQAPGTKGKAATKAVVKAAIKHTFQADETASLVSLLSRYAPGADPTGWEFNMIIALKILKAMVVEWRKSASDVVPPDWLLKGVTSLVVQLMSLKEGGDGVKVCCLELGVSLLHGGDNYFQKAFLDNFEKKGGAPEFFEEVQRRLRSATEEDRRAKIAQLNPQLQRTSEQMIATRYRALHTLVVQAAREGENSTNSYVEVVLRFLHLLCEGHNMKLQNYLRHQPGSPHAVNIVAATANYVDSVTRYIGPSNVQKVTAAMNAISEFIQNPCRANQRLLVDTRLCISANEILALRLDETQGPSSEELGKALGGVAHQLYSRDFRGLKAATATCLLSLLECVDQSYIPERMLTALEPQQLLDNMNRQIRLYNPWLMVKLKDQVEELALDLSEEMQEELFDNLSANEESSDTPDPEAAEEAEAVAQQYYITYITLARFDGTGRMGRRCTPEYILDLANLERKVGVIEIARNGKLEKAYFTIPAVCQYLSKRSKQALVLNVNRSNLQMQLTDFTGRFDTLYQEMKHTQTLTERPILSLFRRTLDMREKAFFINALIMNLLMLIFTSYECDGSFICGDAEDLTTARVKPGWKELLDALIWLQCVLALTRLWWYAVERGEPLINQRIEQHRINPPTSRLFAWLVRLPPEQSDPTFRHKLRKRPWYLAPMRIDVVRGIYMLSDLRFWGITLQAIFSLLALMIPGDGPMFLLIQLLEVFNHSMVLQNVIRSITSRPNALLQTGGMALIMYYFFGVIGFVLFPEMFQFERADIMGGRKQEPNNNGARCTTIWKCTLVVFDIGMRTGDLGEAMADDQITWKVDVPGMENESDRYLMLFKMVYTFLFYIMVTTILMNIIFGIIIDTFAELRERKEHTESLISGKCFICGIDRFIFDQASAGGNGFENHVSQDHNMWRYLFFHVYLMERDFDDYSGGESYVSEKTLQLVKDADTHETVMDIDTGRELKISKQQQDLLWFPQRDAMCLAGQGSSEDQALAEQLEGLERNSAVAVVQLTAKMDSILAARGQTPT